MRPLCNAMRPRIWSTEPERVPCANFAIDDSGRCNAHHERTARKTTEKKRQRALAAARTLSVSDLEAVLRERRMVDG